MASKDENEWLTDERGPSEEDEAYERIHQDIEESLLDSEPFFRKAEEEIRRSGKRWPAPDTTKSAYELMIEYFKQMKLKWVDDVYAYYICSLGSHFVNLRAQSDEPIAPDFGRRADLRSHTFLLAPRGVGKDMVLDMHLDKKTGLIGDIVPSRIRISMTEASLTTGQIQETIQSIPVPGAPSSRVITKDYTAKGGLAEYLSDGILAFPEFSSIAESATQSHSKTLMNYILEILSDGRIGKELASIGGYDQETHLTMWMCSQPQRVDVAEYATNGLDRRVLIMQLLLGDDDINEYIDLFWEGAQMWPNKDWIKAIRRKIRELKDGKDTIERIEIAKSVKEYIKNTVRGEGGRFVDQPIYRNLAVGYNFMRYFKRGTKTFRVKLDDELKRLIDLQKKYRDETFGSENEVMSQQILVTVASRPDPLQRTLTKIRKVAWIRYTIKSRDFSKVIGSLEESGRLVGKDLRLRKKGRTPTILFTPSQWRAYSNKHSV